MMKMMNCHSSTRASKRATTVLVPAASMLALLLLLQAAMHISASLTTDGEGAVSAVGTQPPPNASLVKVPKVKLIPVTPSNSTKTAVITLGVDPFSGELLAPPPAVNSAGPSKTTGSPSPTKTPAAPAPKPTINKPAGQTVNVNSSTNKLPAMLTPQQVVQQLLALFTRKPVISG